MGRPVTDRPCPNAKCAMFGKTGKGNVVLHSFLKLKRGRRRLVDRKLTFRDVFTAVESPFSFVVALIGVRWPRKELSQHFVAA